MLEMILSSNIGLGCRCVVSWYDLCLTFDLGSAKIFSCVIFKIHFSYHKTIRIFVTDCCVYVHLILLSSLISIFQLISRSINKFDSFITLILQMNAVILIKIVFYLYFVTIYSVHFCFLSTISPPLLHNLHCQF